MKAWVTCAVIPAIMKLNLVLIHQCRKTEIQDIPVGFDLHMYLQCGCVGLWYKCKLLSMQCVNGELIAFACTWAVRVALILFCISKSSLNNVEAQFQSGCEAINWTYGFICLFVNVVLLDVWCVIIHNYSPYPHPHAQNVFIPCANIN